MSNHISMHIPLDYANTLPNFQNTFPRLVYEIQEQGPILVTRRYMLLSSTYICRQELVTESIDHMLQQVITEDEFRRIGKVYPVA